MKSARRETANDKVSAEKIEMTELTLKKRNIRGQTSAGLGSGEEDGVGVGVGRCGREKLVDGVGREGGGAQRRWRWWWW